MRLVIRYRKFTTNKYENTLTEFKEFLGDENPDKVMDNLASQLNSSSIRFIRYKNTIINKNFILDAKIEKEDK